MIGGAGKKIQTIVELAEELYERVNELRSRLEEVDRTVEETAERVESLERDVAEQRALLEALAGAEGIDVDAVVGSEVDVAGSGPEGDDEGPTAGSPEETTTE